MGPAKRPAPSRRGPVPPSPAHVPTFPPAWNAGDSPSGGNVGRRRGLGRHAQRSGSGRTRPGPRVGFPRFPRAGNVREAGCDRNVGGNEHRTERPSAIAGAGERPRAKGWRRCSHGPRVDGLFAYGLQLHRGPGDRGLGAATKSVSGGFHRQVARPGVSTAGPTLAGAWGIGVTRRVDSLLGLGPRSSNGPQVGHDPLDERDVGRKQRSRIRQQCAPSVPLLSRCPSVLGPPEELCDVAADALGQGLESSESGSQPSRLHPGDVGSREPRPDTDIFLGETPLLT